METLHIIKVGGNIIDVPEELDAFLDDFTRLPGAKLLVHGGGKLATEFSLKLGLGVKMVNGRRITDAPMLMLITMVYAGWINKTIVAKLQSMGCNALGLTGADGRCITAVKRSPGEVDFGFAGDIAPGLVNTTFFEKLIGEGIVPVVAPVTADIHGQLLNTNADTAASVLARAFSEKYKVSLFYCFEKNGVLLDKDNDSSVISDLDRISFENLKSEKIVEDGMIAKLENAFSAREQGVSSVVIAHASNLMNVYNNSSCAGTRIHI